MPCNISNTPHTNANTYILVSKCKAISQWTKLCIRVFVNKKQKIKMYTSNTYCGDINVNDFYIQVTPGTYTML